MGDRQVPANAMVFVAPVLPLFQVFSSLEMAHPFAHWARICMQGLLLWVPYAQGETEYLPYLLSLFESHPRVLVHMTKQDQDPPSLLHHCLTTDIMGNRPSLPRGAGPPPPIVHSRDVPPTKGSSPCISTRSTTPPWPK